MSVLTGVRILGLALNVPRPLAVARLVAPGASATKVEPPFGDWLARSSRTWSDALHAGVPVSRLDLRPKAAAPSTTACRSAQ